MLTKEDVAKYWTYVEQALIASHELVRDSFTPDQILAKIIQGDVQLWALLADDDVRVLMMSQLYNTGTMRVFQIFWAYGDDLLPALPMLSDAFDHFARHHGADKIEIQGRKGFERVLKAHNFAPEYITFSRPVRAVKGN